MKAHQQEIDCRGELRRFVDKRWTLCYVQNLPESVYISLVQAQTMVGELGLSVYNQLCIDLQEQQRVFVADVTFPFFRVFTRVFGRGLSHEA